MARPFAYAALAAALSTAPAALAAPGVKSTSPADLPAGNYVLDKTHAVLTAKLSHMGFSNYTLRFTKLDASFTYDPKAPEASKISVTVDPASIDTSTGADAFGLKFNKELAGDGWLETAKYPTITFVSTKVDVGDGKTGKVTEEKKANSQIAPQLYDLTTLQREAPFSAKGTLQIAQALYEKHKMITYPRTDSRYLPEDYTGNVRETMADVGNSDLDVAKYAKAVLAGSADNGPDIGSRPAWSVDLLCKTCGKPGLPFLCVAGVFWIAGNMGKVAHFLDRLTWLVGVVEHDIMRIDQIHRKKPWLALFCQVAGLAPQPAHGGLGNDAIMAITAFGVSDDVTDADVVGEAVSFHFLGKELFRCVELVYRLE